MGPGRRLLTGYCSCLTSRLPGLKPLLAGLRQPDWSSLVNRGRAGSRAFGTRAREHLECWWKSLRALSQRIAERVHRSQFLAKARLKLNALEKWARQIDWSTALASCRSRLIVLARCVIRRDGSKSLVPTPGRNPGMVGCNLGLTRSLYVSRDWAACLWRRGWTSAISSCQVTVEKLSNYAMRRGLALARNAIANAPAPKIGEREIEMVQIDPESPFGYAKQSWSTKAMDAYLITLGARNWEQEIRIYGDCPIGYTRQVLVDPLPQQVESTEFHPESFLLILFDAYSQVVENRDGDIQDFAPVVPLVDVYSWVASSEEPSKNYSKQELLGTSTSSTVVVLTPPKMGPRSVFLSAGVSAGKR